MLQDKETHTVGLVFEAANILSVTIINAFDN